MKIFLRRHLDYYRRGRALATGPLAARARIDDQRETSKPHDRTAVINLLLSTFDRPTTYLEIGVRKPKDNYDHVRADHKYGVDPGLEYAPNPVSFPLTSDAFFHRHRIGDLPGAPATFDLVFIDGLHHAEQVDRDIRNALLTLAPDGFVVLHDCNPSSVFHAREDFEYRLTPAGGRWNGTTWKAYLKWRGAPDIYSCCVDTDYGVAILSRHTALGQPSGSHTNEFYEYNILHEHRHELLGLLSLEALAALLSQA